VLTWNKPGRKRVRKTKKFKYEVYIQINCDIWIRSKIHQNACLLLQQKPAARNPLLEANQPWTQPMIRWCLSCNMCMCEKPGGRKQRARGNTQDLHDLACLHP